MSTIVERTEVIVPGPAEGLSRLLGVPPPDLRAGEPLPLLWHWVYLLDRPAQGDLGPDGHPLRGTILAPPGAGRRRMWAGGRVETRGTLRPGEPATRCSEVQSVTEKQGRAGPLSFVTVRHRISQRRDVVIDEHQEIVYRSADVGGPPADEPAPSYIAAGADEWSLPIDPVFLFRFSALTYNAHRIHYDRDYARTVEGYRGLLTHGPLQAIAMAEAARARGMSGDLRMTYRLTAPLFDDQGLVARATAQSGGQTITAVRDLHGRQTATGLIEPH